MNNLLDYPLHHALNTEVWFRLGGPPIPWQVKEAVENYVESEVEDASLPVDETMAVIYGVP